MNAKTIDYAHGIREHITLLANERDAEIERIEARLGTKVPRETFDAAWQAYRAASSPLWKELQALGCGECPTCSQPVRTEHYGLPNCQFCGDPLRPDVLPHAIQGYNVTAW